MKKWIVNSIAILVMVLFSVGMAIALHPWNLYPIPKETVADANTFTASDFNESWKQVIGTIDKIYLQALTLDLAHPSLYCNDPNWYALKLTVIDPNGTYTRDFTAKELIELVGQSP